MPNYLLYNTDTMKIVATGNCAEDQLHLQDYPDRKLANIVATIPPDETRDDYLVRNGALERRPVLPITISKSKIKADDRDEAVLSGFPANAEVSIDGETYAVGTGVLTITSPMPATYTIACNIWPYLAWETIIEAVA